MTRKRVQLQKLVFVVIYAFIPLLGYLHYGPNMGMGLLMAASALTAVLFYGLKAGLAVILLTVVTVSFGAAGQMSGSIHFVPAPSTTGEWFGIGITVVAMQIALAGTFHMMMGRLKRAIASESDARQRELLAQREREETMRAVASAQRLEALGRLSGGVAHDFNNAMTVARAAIWVLEDDESPAEERAEALRDLDSAVEGAIATTRQLRAFSYGAQPGEKARPHECIATIATGLKRLIPSDIELVTRCEPVPAISVEKGAFNQAILNLALNARDAIERGGRIELSCEQRGDSVVIRVQDNGKGMDEETQSRILEPFFTTKAGLGTGLGLSMVHGTIAAAGGELRVISQQGVGTTFEVIVPVAAARGPVATTVETSPVPGRPCVLVVEDEPAVLKLIVRYLEQSGFDTRSVESVADAHALVGTVKFHALCTDGILPDGRASDVIDAFRHEYGATPPIIVCSGYLPDDLNIDFDADKIEFVGKPFAPGALVQSLQAMLASDSATARQTVV